MYDVSKDWMLHEAGTLPEEELWSTEMVRAARPVNRLGPVCLGVIGTECNGVHGPGTGQPCASYM